MKSPWLFLLVLLLCLAGCAAERQPSMPALATVQNGAEATGDDQVFPRGRWQFVHAIDFSIAGHAGAQVLGVTSLTGEEMACALMTVEGFTLFEAVYRQGEGVDVRRAVPPFDKPAFAAGLMTDVRTIFLAPGAASRQCGRAADGTSLCRYTEADGEVTDIVLPATGECWQIRTYGADQRLVRSVVGRSCRKMGALLVPEYLELKGFGPANYTLKMTLIRAENLGRQASQ